MSGRRVVGLGSLILGLATFVLGHRAEVSVAFVFLGVVLLSRSRQGRRPTDPNWPIRRGLLLSALGFAGFGGAGLVGALTTKNPAGRSGVNSPRGMIMAGSVALFFLALLFLGGWWRARRFGRGEPPGGWYGRSRQD
jgi:hypothetical protein